ncbi:MAG: MBOAT family protein [Bacteroidales bacterium]|nr:MBOAT family protein [Bacteroidales bacterium]
MSFQSFAFLLFFTALFALYYFICKGKVKWQNLLLLVGSYFFYGYANWKMLPLLVAVTLIYYCLGLSMRSARSEKRRSTLSTLGIVLGVGLLVYFKYLNFFIDSFAKLFESLGLKANIHTFRIILPLGISFFVFKLISYVIEINRGHIEPSRDIVAFATYVSFFPCIMAGPIDRPGFLRQLDKEREFDYGITVDGCRQFIWGMFKKVAIADNIAGCVDSVWNSGGFAGMPGGSLLIVAILYSFQMYMDFSGYSDMAIGVGKALGLKVARNFNYPFFAVNVADYWRRWHMSLTSWLTDYVFMPLNVRFRDWGKFGMILAIVINFILVGMWHGDNWTYALFGLYHGLLFIPLILSGAFFKKAKLKTGALGLPCLKDCGRMLLTFLLVTVGLIIFRADSVGHAFAYLGNIFISSILSFSLENRHLQCFAFILVTMVIEWIQRKKEYALDLDGVKSVALRYVIYLAVILVTLVFSTDSSAFIYAQF